MRDSSLRLLLSAAVSATVAVGVVSLARPFADEPGKGESATEHAPPDLWKSDRFESLSRRLVSLENEVSELRQQVRATSAAQTASHSDENGDVEETVKDQIASALTNEREAALARRIVVKQEQDSALVDEFSEAAGIDATTAEALEAEYLAVTAKHLTLIDNAEHGTISWDEARSEMKENWASGQSAVRELLDDDQFRELASIAKKHSTTLFIETTEPSEDEQPIR